MLLCLRLYRIRFTLLCLSDSIVEVAGVVLCLLMMTSSVHSLTMGGAETEKPIVEKIGDAGSKASGVLSHWWQLTTADRRPRADPANATTIDKVNRGVKKIYQITLSG